MFSVVYLLAIYINTLKFSESRMRKIWFARASLVLLLCVHDCWCKSPAMAIAGFWRALLYDRQGGPQLLSDLSFVCWECCLPVASPLRPPTNDPLDGTNAADAEGNTPASLSALQ